MAIKDIRGGILSGADPPISTNPNPDLAIKAPVRAATTGANITLSGLQTVDGVSLNAGDRVLVKDQTDQTTNGIYNAQTGPWTLTIDANNNSQWTTGTQVAVAAGSINSGNSYKLTTAIPVILGTSLMTFALVTASNAGGANPTAKVGLSVVNGTALTYMRSDAAPPIDQSISPTWTGAHTFSQGVTVSVASLTGTQASNFSTNAITISADTVNAGGNFGVGMNLVYNFGGSAMQGGREAFQATANLIATTNAANANRNYVGVVGVAAAIVTDGGTGTTPATSKGAMFGSNFVGCLFNGATNFLGVSACEFNSFIQAGASSTLKSIIQLTADPRDGVSGSQVDAMVWCYAGITGLPNWTTGLQFGGVSGAGNWPIKSTGTIIGTTSSGTAALGVDFSNTTFSTGAFKSNGFLVDGSGNVVSTGTLQSGLNGGTGGELTLLGSTSGSVSLLASSTGSQLTITQGVTIGIAGVQAGTLLLAGATSGAAEISSSATGGTLQLNSTACTVDSSGDLVCLNLAITASIFRTQTLATLTGTSGTVNSSTQVINASGSFTLTLPSAAFSGQWQWVKTIANQTVSSASSNVIPLAGGAAGTSILAATAGKWAFLQSDGTNWNIIAAN